MRLRDIARADRGNGIRRCKAVSSDEEHGDEFRMRRTPGACTLLAFVLAASGCGKTAGVVEVGSLKALHADKSRYNDLVVRVHACAYGVPHGIGLVDCSGDQSTMTSILSDGSETTEAAVDRIVAAIAKSWFEPGPMLPMTLEGRFLATGPEVRAAIELRSVEFEKADVASEYANARYEEARAR